MIIFLRKKVKCSLARLILVYSRFRIDERKMKIPKLSSKAFLMNKSIIGLPITVPLLFSISQSALGKGGGHSSGHTRHSSGHSTHTHVSGYTAVASMLASIIAQMPTGAFKTIGARKERLTLTRANQAQG
jgi:hypothetical protein